VNILVDWPATAMSTAGIAVLLGYAWWRRGCRGAVQACAAVGAWRLLYGAAAGNVITLAEGAVILVVTGWCAWYLREPRQPRRQGR
jgi:hypothetical protein